MKDYFQPERPYDLRPHIASAALDIQHYTAIFVLKDKRVGSGIFVNTGGYYGILTAHHVARPVLEDSEFSLVVTNYAHILVVRSDHCQHVPIGYVWNNPHKENGPDLSLIIIRDANLLGTLRSRKSFCYLDSKDLGYFQTPLERNHWCISGSPYEGSKVVGKCPDGQSLTKFQDFIGEATFHSRTERDGFDFIKLKVTTGQADFPKDFEGMSGGGFWLVPLSIEETDDPNNPKTIQQDAPILAGVSFYQDEPENGERVITGHGYDSIYSRVRQTLKELKVE